MYDSKDCAIHADFTSLEWASVVLAFSAQIPEPNRELLPY